MRLKICVPLCRICNPIRLKICGGSQIRRNGNTPEFQLLSRDVQDMAVRSILDAGASVRQAVSHSGLTTKQIRKRYDK